MYLQYATRGQALDFASDELAEPRTLEALSPRGLHSYGAPLPARAHAVRPLHDAVDEAVDLVQHGVRGRAERLARLGWRTGEEPRVPPAWVFQGTTAFPGGVLKAFLVVFRAYLPELSTFYVPKTPQRPRLTP